MGIRDVVDRIFGNHDRASLDPDDFVEFRTADIMEGADLVEQLVRSGVDAVGADSRDRDGHVSLHRIVVRRKDFDRATAVLAAYRQENADESDRNPPSRSSRQDRRAELTQHRHDY